MIYVCNFESRLIFFQIGLSHKKFFKCLPENIFKLRITHLRNQIFCSVIVLQRINVIKNFLFAVIKFSVCEFSKFFSKIVTSQNKI